MPLPLTKVHKTGTSYDHIERPKDQKTIKLPVAIGLLHSICVTLPEATYHMVRVEAAAVQAAREEVERAGMPSMYSIDIDKGELEVYPAPDKDYALQIHFYPPMVVI